MAITIPNFRQTRVGNNFTVTLYRGNQAFANFRSLLETGSDDVVEGYLIFMSFIWALSKWFFLRQKTTYEIIESIIDLGNLLPSRILFGHMVERFPCMLTRKHFYEDFSLDLSNRYEIVINCRSDKT